MQFIPAYITLNIIMAVIPNYLPLLLRGLGYNPGMVGVFLAIAEGAGILSPFLFGRFTDKYGKYRGSIIFAYFLPAAAALPLAFIVHPVINAVLVAMLVVGYRSANPLIEAVTSISLGKTGNYGRIRIFGSIAYVCFLFLLQWIPVLRPDTPLNISIWTFLAALLAIVSTFFLPSNRAGQSTAPENQVSEIPVESTAVKSIWTPVFIIGLISIALSRLAMTSIYSFFSLFLVDYMKWNAVGLMIGLSGIAEIPLIYFSHRLIKRFGAMPLLAFTSLMVALRLLLYAFFPFKAGIVAAQLLHCFCFGLFHPAAIAFISNSVPAKQRSFGMTLYLSFGWGLPTLIGNSIGGFIVDYTGYRSLFGYFSIFAVLGALVYVVYRIAGYLCRQKNRLN